MIADVPANLITTFDIDLGEWKAVGVAGAQEVPS